MESWGAAKREERHEKMWYGQPGTRKKALWTIGQIVGRKCFCDICNGMGGFGAGSVEYAGAGGCGCDQTFISDDS